MAVDRLVWKIVLDVLVLATVGFSLLALVIWAEPYRRGYFPNDNTLRLPYKPQTISEGLLAGIGFALIIVTTIINELILEKTGDGVGEKFLSGSLIPGWVWESYQAIGCFTFGAACQQLTTNLAKYVIGRLRPHFFDLCQPVPALESQQNALGYVQAYSCSSPVSPGQLRDMRLSFPSAHSSFAMYTAFFFIFYVQTRCRWRFSKLLRHSIQFAVLMGAWYVGLTRVTDHMHHWGDVAAGFSVGATAAAVTFIFVWKPRRRVEGPPELWPQQRPEHMLPRPVVAR